MSGQTPNIAITVDVTNPGQFFACCGLLELANRLWPGAEARFEQERFVFSPPCELRELLDAAASADLEQLDPEDHMASAMKLGGTFDLTLNWWNEKPSGGKAFKIWAGSMRGVRIARSMQNAMSCVRDLAHLFDHAAPVYDSDNHRKKVEPYYFDSRRGWNAQSLDIGFAPDSLSMTTAAHPAVEFLCLIGLQRFRPAPTERRGVFIYHTWSPPLPAELAAAAAGGALLGSIKAGFRFENAFRTDQKKHKSFLPATPIGEHA